LPVNQETHRSTESTDWKTQQKIQKLEKNVGCEYFVQINILAATF